MRLVVALVLAGCGRSGPVVTTPQHLFEDFTSPNVELFDKYRDGATFTGFVKTVGELEPGKPIVWMDVDGENLLSLELAAPAPANLKAGDLITMTCKIAGASGALMMLTECTGSVHNSYYLAFVRPV